MIKIKDLIKVLEEWAPPAFQEAYDNSGLITGESKAELKGALICLDSTEEVVEEAISRNCNLIIAHHPIIFKGLKRLTGSNYIERTIQKAIKNDIAIYAIHTNLDNVHLGVNQKISEIIGLRNCRVLAPKKGNLSKLTTFIPVKDTSKVMDAIHLAGAGMIGNYKNCSFSVEGTGTFMPIQGANPTIGSQNEQEQVHENRIEVIFPSHLESGVLAALKAHHPYEEVAYYLTPLNNKNQEVGSGMIGNLEKPMAGKEFLLYLKEKMNLSCIRHTAITGEIKKVALCGGAGSFLLPKAINQQADIFITGDFKYHEFFDAEGRILIADIGHYESEVFTKDLIYEYLSEKFTNIALYLSQKVTNPISYL
ncbi:Nif3-like dinuclear metal center hexameric protein [Xanthovirga aplysinae]|uniref:Nif3-like dinuclear metal center hexameric protein n=1 Tax=Xanthovirga aplysinae TaxID=2529853 RepID=UPI0012BB74B4|nr:Nif3-like dinuclear metal center hexameric protein [Xanthovirga aplysinae]MTI30672.1 Nif3-like dinuclear metal center hexameric protein [Xanthovirga aplysinae]